MAKQKQKQVEADELQVGTWHKFNGYAEEQEEPTLEEGVLVEILGYDGSEEVYNVRDAAGNKESLYTSELDEDEVEPPAKKKAKKAKVEDDDEEDEDDKPKAKKAKAKKPTVYTDMGILVDEEIDTKEAKTAMKEMKALAKANDIDPEDYETWELLGAYLDSLEDEEEAPKEKAAKPAKTPPAEVAVLPPVKKTTSVQNAIKEYGGDALQAAAKLIDRVDSTYFTLGGVLAEISQKKLYEQLLDEDDKPLYSGQPGFAAYCENTLGLKYRKAQYLIQLYTKFVALGFTEKKLAGIGWTKLRELVNVVDEDNVEEWLAAIKDQSVKEIQESVKIALQQDGDGTGTGSGTGTKGGLAQVVKFTFVAHQDKAEVWKEALQKAAEVLGIEEDAEAPRNSAALDHIISEWLAMPEE